MKKIFLGFIALTLSVVNCQLSTISAAPRTPEQAQALAKQFLAEKQPTNFQNIKRSIGEAPLRLVHTTNKPASAEPALYIFNNDNNNGWVIISADDNARTILGYSTNGSFQTTNIPANIRFWLDYYAERIAAAKPSISKIKKSTQATYDPVAPLLERTQWDQGEPYNNLCPIDQTDNTRCATGCVATATAQVMRHWEWPTQGTSSHTNNWNNASYGGSGYGSEYADFGATTYDWANMIDNYNYGYNSTQAEAIATLMYHLGIASDMTYGGDEVEGSGTFTTKMQNGMTTYFKYNASYKNYGDADNTLKTTFANELKAGRPVIIGGSDGGSYGHEFVCDGVDKDGYFHINWGWGGTSDGFFELTALDPDEEGIGGANSGNGYAKDIDYIYNISPKTSTTSLTSVAVSPATMDLKLNEKKRVLPVFTPALATNRAMYWTSENESIATVTCDGIVQGISSGTTNIIAHTYDGNKTGSCAVTVSSTPYTPTVLSVDEAYITYDNSLIFPWGLRVYDKTTEEPWVKFNFKNEYSNKIAGTYNLGSSTYYWPDASNENLLLTSTHGTLTLTLVGEKNGTNGCNTYRIQASFETDELITYSIDATLEICATKGTASGAAITLKDELPVAVTGVTISPATLSLDQKEKKTLTATIAPSNASNKAVTWSSDAPAIATVDANGKVTGVAEGTAHITVTTVDGGFTDVATITVSDQVTTTDAVFVLLTDADEMEAGDEIILVSTSKGKANGDIDGNNTQSYLTAVDVTIVSNTIDLADNTKVVRMTVGGTKGAWTFANSKGKLLGATAAKKVYFGDGKTKWSVSIVGGNATIQNETNSYGRFLYNVNSPRFNSYASSTAISNTMYLPQIFIHKGPSSGGTTTAIDNLDTEAQHSVKRIENGQLVIIIDGVKYNIFGQKL